MLEETQFLFQCCITSVSQCPTNQILETFDIRNRIWLLKKYFSCDAHNTRSSLSLYMLSVWTRTPLKSCARGRRVHLITLVAPLGWLSVIMVVTCYAVGCNNRTTKASTVGFFRFPAFPEDRRKRWIQAMRRDKWMPSKWSRVCGSHFVTGILPLLL